VKQLVPVLFTAALFATVCTWAALLTGMDTTFWVAGVIAACCLCACIGIIKHAERERARSAPAREAWFASFDRSRRIRQAARDES
jgi:hypothetical protein